LGAKSGTAIPKRSIIAVINPAAGRAGPRALHDMEQLFDEMKVKAQVLAPDPSDLTGVLTSSIAAHPDLLVVLAGDGTARAAAELCGPKGPLLATLPGGTMNMLPKALYGEADWKDALRETLQHGVERPVGGGEIGGHTFYCAAMIGATALFAPAREAVRSRDVGDALIKARDAYRRAFAGRIRFETDGGHNHKTQSLTLLCPLISKVMDNDASKMEVAAIDPRNAAEAVRISARVVMSALIGDWRDDPAVSLGRARKGRVWARRSIPALLDGEQIRLGRSAEFKFHPKAFRALAPPADKDDQV
jgi:diacylglycerol kinase family enzyme